MKESVLMFLKEAEEGYVSGQTICDRLKKSRTAVWYAIDELRDLGYIIEAFPRKGYRLVQGPDRLFPWEVAPYLTTKKLGRVIDYHDSVDSTNDIAKNAAKAGAEEGLVVVAEEQVRGKGRRGRSWRSPHARGIWSTTILRPVVSPYEAPKMALVAALATAKSIEKTTGLVAGVKWPNDVLVGGKKVAGILVEMDAEIDVVRYLIVGVGINVNLLPEELPPEVRSQATTLRTELGREVDRRQLLAQFLNDLEGLYSSWQEQGFSGILNELKERTVTLGQHVSVIEANRRWSGIAQDIGEDGALIVKAADGQVRSVYAAEVSIRPADSN